MKVSDNDVTEACETLPLPVKSGDYITGKMIYDFGTRKQSEKKFVGMVIKDKAGRNKNRIEVSYMRKTRLVNTESEVTYYFTYPNIKDQWVIDADQIMQKINIVKIVRGKHYFTDIPIDDVE